MAGTAAPGGTAELDTAGGSAERFEALARWFAIGRFKWLASLVPILFFVSWEYGWHVRGHAAVDSDPLAFMMLVATVAFGGSVMVFAQLHLLDRAQRALRATNAALARQARSLEALYELGMRLSGLHRLATIEETAIQRARELFDADTTGLALFDEASRTMRWRLYDSRCDGPRAERYLETRLGECVGGDVVLSGEALVVPDNRGTAPAGPVARHLAAVGELRAAMTVPIRVGGRPVGALLIGHSEPRAYALDDIRLATGIANQLGAAINNSRLYERLAGYAAVEERERLAREMHDGLAQLLAALLAHLAAATAALQEDRPGDCAKQLGRMRQIAQDAYLEVRQGILGLRLQPRSEEGFATTLRTYVERFSLQSGIGVRFESEVDDEAFGALPWDAAVQAIRIVQEALMNVAKHSGADSARVRLEKDPDGLRILVEDDGRGFDPGRVASAGTRFGLATMHERAEAVGGSLSVDSARGRGTRVLLVLPLGATRRLPS